MHTVRKNFSDQRKEASDKDQDANKNWPHNLSFF